MRFELIRITLDPLLRQTFHFQIINRCSQDLTFAAFQVPDGLTALHPVNKRVYKTIGRRAYVTQNPSVNPFYSVRFLARGAGIPSGQSDAFRYTLPPQADPSYIRVAVRPRGQDIIETHLNTFECPVVDETSKPVSKRRRRQQKKPDFLLFPNPTAGALFADLSAWSGQVVQLRVLNAQGQLVQTAETVAAAHTSVALPDELVGGLYWLSVYASNGERQMRRYVLNR